MHAFVSDQVGKGHLQRHKHMYVWNDAVLLLAYIDNKSDFNAILREADNLQRKLDEKFKPSYAIAVKGQAFPVQVDREKRVTIIEASSYAMANCFRIEEKARREKWQKQWYVDSRIGRRIATTKPPQKEEVKLLPGNKVRTIYLYDGHLWNGLCPP